jgi:hypothetical protein
MVFFRVYISSDYFYLLDLNNQEHANLYSITYLVIINFDKINFDFLENEHLISFTQLINRLELNFIQNKKTFVLNHRLL